MHLGHVWLQAWAGFMKDFVSYYAPFREAVQALAALDALQSLASLASLPEYACASLLSYYPLAPCFL